MRPDPFSDPGDGGRQPDNGPPPAEQAAEPGPLTGAEPGPSAGAGAGPAQQGLFVCLPAGSLDTGRFAQCGPAADMPPDPLLAAVIDTVTGQDGKGLAGCSDDQLIGVIAAVRRLEARAAWYLLAAVGEFAARMAGEPCGAEFGADQLACELHLTRQGAAAQMDYARAVTGRLPATFAALRAGTIHPVHARIIEEETGILSDQDAARADAVLAEAAGSLTFGRLRSAAHRLVLELDPESAGRRAQAARRDAHVRPFREYSGNAGMVARELPPDEVLASWQHVEQRALDLRAAGLPGTLAELRVRAYLDLLQERDSRPAEPVPDSTGAAGPGDTGEPAGPQDDRDGDGPDDTGQPGPQDDGGGDGPDDTGQPGPQDDGPDDTGQPGPQDDGGGADGHGGGPGGGSGPGGPGRGPGAAGSPGGSGRTRRPGRDTGPSFAALVNITVPWSAMTGPSGIPAEVAGFGLIHAADARDLLAAAARDPRTRWCVTALHPDGTAAAHGCAAGRHPPPGADNPAATPGPDPPPATGNPAAAPGPDPPPGTSLRDWIARLNIQLAPIARGTCGHDQAEVGYRPSRALQHLVKTRNARCTAPGCSRPAARCDLDHTIAWDKGGITCECDLAPLCRHHHRCKQAQGWQLTQPEPGVLIWRTPAGRTYATRPTQYPA